MAIPAQAGIQASCEKTSIMTETPPSPDTSSPPPERKDTPTLFILFYYALTVLILDQATKAMVQLYMPLFDVRVIVPGFFNLVHVRNTGAAFSVLAGPPTLWRHVFFIGINVVAVGVIFYIHNSFKHRDLWPRRALGLILGGAVGNLADRIRLGEVVDFLDFHLGGYHWPAFNVADSAITIGCGILLVSLLRFQNRP